MTGPRPGGRGPAPGSDSMLPRILAIVAGAALVGGLTCVILKTSVVKPGRIIAAANSTAVHETLPSVILQVVMDGPLAQLKSLKLSATALEPTAQAAFPSEWVATELEVIVHEVARALKAGEPVRMDLRLEPIKGDIAGAIEKLLREHVDQVPYCAAKGATLCKPDGSAARFIANVGRVVAAVVEKMPDDYPILAGPAADGVKSLQGVLGSLGWAAVVFLLLGLGAGALAFSKKEDDTPLLESAGIGLAAGSLVLILIVYSVKGAVLGGLGGAISGYEAAVAQNLTAFVSKALGGGFTIAFVALAVTLVAGGGAIFLARQNS